MELKLSKKQLRRLCDMVYIGNWVLNAAREDQRFQDYDEVESLIFGYAVEAGMYDLGEMYQGQIVPSRAFMEGGIHEAIADYEDAVFFDILAEELARRDMDEENVDEDNTDELTRRMEKYIEEFEAHGTDNIMVELDD